MNQSIALDVTHLGREHPTGVERYVDALIPTLTALLLSKGLSVYWVDHRSSLPYELPEGVTLLSSPYKKGWSQRSIPKLLQNAQIDLFFTPSGIPPLKWKGKTAFTVHDMAAYDSPSSFSMSNLYRLRILSRKAAERASLLVVPSLYTQKRVQEEWGKKLPITCIAHGFTAVNIPQAENPQKPTLPLFTYVGRIETKKNLSTVIEAFVALLLSGQEAELQLIGSSGFGAVKIEQSIAELPPTIRQRIHLKGFLSDEQKYALIQRSVALLVPCPIEGFGLPVLEGFAAETPVICSQAGALPEVAGEAALFVGPYSVEQWQKTMQKVLSSQFERKNRVELGTKQLHRYSWITSQKQTARALISLLEK